MVVRMTERDYLCPNCGAVLWTRIYKWVKLSGLRSKCDNPCHPLYPLYPRGPFFFFWISALALDVIHILCQDRCRVHYSTHSGHSGGPFYIPSTGRSTGSIIYLIRLSMTVYGCLWYFCFLSTLFLGSRPCMWVSLCLLWRIRSWYSIMTLKFNLEISAWQLCR